MLTPWVVAVLLTVLVVFIAVAWALAVLLTAPGAFIAVACALLADTRFKLALSAFATAKVDINMIPIPRIERILFFMGTPH
jgi:hypothetical protein